MERKLLKPAFERRKCIVTTKEYTTDNVLLQEEFKTIDKNGFVLLNWGMLPETQLVLESGFVALIGIDTSRSIRNEHGFIAPEQAYRTGHVMYLKDEFFLDIFELEKIPDNRFSFVDTNTLNKIIDA
jgi:hypothetical protein